MPCFVLQNIAINRNQPEFDDEEEDVYARAQNNRVPLLANDIPPVTGRISIAQEEVRLREAGKRVRNTVASNHFGY